MQATVFMESWEIECCQPPPAVGDHVSWRLHWVPTHAGPGIMDLDIRAAAITEETADRPSSEVADGLIVVSGPVTAWWSGGTLPVPAGASRGLPVVDAHEMVPDSLVPVAGRVVAVEVVTQEYRRSGWRAYEPVREDFSLRRVERSPKWFDSGWVPTENTFGEGPAVDRKESGVLVHLDVDESRA